LPEASSSLCSKTVTNPELPRLFLLSGLAPAAPFLSGLVRFFLPRALSPPVRLRCCCFRSGGLWRVKEPLLARALLPAHKSEMAHHVCSMACNIAREVNLTQSVHQAGPAAKLTAKREKGVVRRFLRVGLGCSATGSAAVGFFKASPRCGRRYLCMGGNIA
jgi:hypothetical protein